MGENWKDLAVKFLQEEEGRLKVHNENLSKKLLASFLATTMVVSPVATSLVSADDGVVEGEEESEVKEWGEEEFTFEGFTYVENDLGEIKIIDYDADGFGVTVEIPAEIDNKPVVEIGESAFDTKEISSLVFNEGLEVIGINAFAGNNINKVTLPDSLKEIQRGAFLDTKLEEVEFGTGLEVIGGWAFLSNNLKNLDFGDNLSSIGEMAFKSNGLIEVSFGSGLLNVGDEAFADNELEVVHLHKEVVYGNKVFAINNITDFTYDEGLEALPEGVFVDNSFIEVKGYEGIKKIGNGAFSNNEIVEVEFWDSLEEIGNLSFELNEIETVTLLSGIGKVGNGAFSQNKLTRVEVLGDEIEFSHDPFYLNQDVKSDLVIVGKYSEELEDFTYTFGYTFERMFGEEDVVDLSELTYEVDEFSATITGYSGEGGVVVLPDSIEGKQVNSIGEGAFLEKDIDLLILPRHLFNVGKDAFKGNNLTELNLGNVSNVGESAFEGNSIKKLTGLSNLTLINNFAFKDNEINKLTLGDSTKIIGEYAFENNSISELALGGVEVIGKNAFSKNWLTAIDLGDNVRIIGDNAFTFNVLTEVNFGEGLEDVGNSAFEYNAIVDVELLSGVGYGERVFAHNKVENVSIADGVKKITKEMFLGNEIKNLVVGGIVEEIGNGAFANNKIVNLFLGDKVDVIENNAFSMNRLVKVTILGDVVSIGINAFRVDEGVAKPTIYGKEGSSVESYALSNGYDFKVYEGGEPEPEEPEEPETPVGQEYVVGKLYAENDKDLYVEIEGDLSTEEIGELEFKFTPSLDIRSVEKVEFKSGKTLLKLNITKIKEKVEYELEELNGEEIKGKSFTLEIDKGVMNVVGLKVVKENELELQLKESLTSEEVSKLALEFSPGLEVVKLEKLSESGGIVKIKVTTKDMLKGKEYKLDKIAGKSLTTSHKFELEWDEGIKGIKSLDAFTIEIEVDDALYSENLKKEDFTFSPTLKVEGVTRKKLSNGKKVYQLEVIEQIKDRQYILTHVGNRLEGDYSFRGIGVMEDFDVVSVKSIDRSKIELTLKGVLSDKEIEKLDIKFTPSLKVKSIKKKENLVRTMSLSGDMTILEIETDEQVEGRSYSLASINGEEFSGSKYEFEGYVSTIDLKSLELRGNDTLILKLDRDITNSELDNLKFVFSPKLEVTSRKNLGNKEIELKLKGLKEDVEYNLVGFGGEILTRDFLFGIKSSVEEGGTDIGDNNSGGNTGGNSDNNLTGGNSGIVGGNNSIGGNSGGKVEGGKTPNTATNNLAGTMLGLFTSMVGGLMVFGRKLFRREE